MKLSGLDRYFLKILETEALLNELLDLAEQMGLEVRRTYLGGAGGGLCRVRGKWVLFVDQSVNLIDQLAQTAEALAQRPDLQNYYIKPQVRQIIEQFGENDRGQFNV